MNVATSFKKKLKKKLETITKNNLSQSHKIYYLEKRNIILQ